MSKEKEDVITLTKGLLLGILGGLILALIGAGIHLLIMVWL